MKESDIKHEAGRFWVCVNKSNYAVMTTGLTHSTSDSVYPKTNDGLSIAKARCDYLARREAELGRKLAK